MAPVVMRETGFRSYSMLAMGAKRPRRRSISPATNELAGARIVQPRQRGAPVGHMQHRDRGRFDDNPLEEIDGDPQVIGHGQSDRVAMGEAGDGGSTAAMVASDRLQLDHHARLHLEKRLAPWEAGLRGSPFDDGPGTT